jgi:hypothetical protein
VLTPLLVLVLAICNCYYCTNLAEFESETRICSYCVDTYISIISTFLTTILSRYIPEKGKTTIFTTRKGKRFKKYPIRGNIVKLCNMIRQFSVLSLFTLLLFTVCSGIISSSSLSLQTTTAAFAQTPSSSSSSSLAQDIIDGTLQGQDSSADDNVLEDNNEFGDEDAAIDQDNEADQDAANVGLQEEDATQEQEQEQDAANTNVDSDVQEGE